MTGPWLNFAVSLALGLLIGIERERRKGEGPGRGAAGIRTFGLATLLGAVAVEVGGHVALLIVLLAVSVFAALSYLRDRGDDPGLTTEIALVAAPLIGGLATSDILLAAALGVTIAFILATKTPVHRLVKGKLTDDEVNDGLVFAIATVVVWPQLPDSAMGPFGALNPHAIWLFAVLVLAIGASGHVLTRILGPKYGLPLAGLASGFVSSAATIGSMATRSAKNRPELDAAVAGATLSSVATFVQLGLLLAVASRPTFGKMAFPLLAGGAVALVYGLIFTLIALRSPGVESRAVGRPFSIWAAMVLTGTLCIMLVVSAWLRETFGELGIALGAAIAGIVDAHSSAIAVASLVSSGKMLATDGVFPILVAMTTNAFSKAAMAFSSSNFAFAMRVLPGLAVSIAATWLIALSATSG
ncbi:MgtC/SapB family protein [Rhizobium sp. RAF56]|uniref:MgtC/SapB family protein n=1 Tax=Rhizobium sp. RAF56 TaxID=3233062 RepID=UPI003F9B7286